jgi:NADH-quinone oxidoreductase subunit M
MILTDKINLLAGAEAFPIDFLPESILLARLSLPLATAIFLFAASRVKLSLLYNLALTSTAISFILSLVLWFTFSATSGGFQSTYGFNLTPTMSFSLRLGVDGISLFFLVLTNLFLYLCVLSQSVTAPKLADRLFHLLFLQWTVIGAFSVLDFLGFFIFFEISLIPIYFLVLVWGSRERRVRASYLISLYTLFGSLFFFFALLYLYSKTGTTDYELLLTLNFTEQDQCFLWLSFFLAFAVKIPLFPLHLWLPEAHVEAPTLGSVILAVLLLKLGTYGLLRYSLPLFPVGTAVFGPLVVTLSVLGRIYTCLTAIRQIDLKKIIAYSSVGHRALVIVGLLAGTAEALSGALFQRISHGVVSGARFFAVGSLYERYSVRSLKYFGGLATVRPIFALVFLVFSLANISFPLTSGFIGEFLLFRGLFRHSFWATIFSAAPRVLGAVYTLWTYNRIFFGNLRTISLVAFRDLSFKEVVINVILLIALFILGLAPHLLLDIFALENYRLLDLARR